MIKGLSSKYGFERMKEWDFSDDGNRFICYSYKGYEVSYLRDGDDYYISPRIGSNILNYNEISVLPHYRSVDYLNGKYNVEDSDIIKLISDMDALIEEVKEAESKIESEEEINTKFAEYLTKMSDCRQKRFEEVLNQVNAIPFEILCDLDEYSYKNLRNYVKNASDMLGRYYKLSCKDYAVAEKRAKLNAPIKNDIYYLDWIEEIINKIC